MGTLEQIDPDNSTIRLGNVRSFGTENRTTDIHVPVTNEIFSSIVFNANDIQDLQAHAAAVPPDPAIISAKKEVAKPVHSSSHAPSSAAGSNNAPRRGGYAGAASNNRSIDPVSRPFVTNKAFGSSKNKQFNDKQDHKHDHKNDHKHDNREGGNKHENKPYREFDRNKNTNTYTKRGTGDSLLHLKTFGAVSGDDANNKPSADFDLEEANRKFDKESEMKKLNINDDANETSTGADGDENAETEKKAPPAYDKSKSFFDSLSPATTVKNVNRSAERQANIETFGAAGISHSWRGGRGGYRGGRGGYRGGNKQ